MTADTNQSRGQEIELIRQARALVDQLCHLTDNPSVYQAGRLAEMHLHMAAWQLAATDEIMPELER